MAEQIRPLWGHPDCQQIATHLYFDKKNYGLGISLL